MGGRELIRADVRVIGPVYANASLVFVVNTDTVKDYADLAKKDPRLARKQGAYSVIGASGQILRRGHDLDRVLLVIDRKLALV